MRLGAVVALAVVPALGAGAQVSYTTIAQTGDVVPNTGGLTAYRFFAPVMNDGGAAAAIMQFDPSSIKTAVTVFPSPGEYRPVAVQGNPAPGAADGAPFGSSFGSLSLNAPGQVGFRAHLMTASLTNDEALFTTPDPASATPVAMFMTAREGDGAPGLPTGVVYARVGADNQAFGPMALSHGGGVAFVAGLAGSGVTTADNKALFAGSPAGPTMLLRQGQAAPHPGFNFSFNSLSLVRPIVNPAGQIAFRAPLTSGSATYQNAGVYLMTPAPSGGGPYKLEQLGSLREGAPGTGYMFSGFTEPSLNPAGYAAFTADLTSTVASQALYVGRPGQLSLVARTGDAAPGATGVGFNKFSAPLLAADNTLAFAGSLLTTNGSNDTGLWVGRGGKVSLLAREGDPTPAGPGTFFGDFTLALPRIATNSHGQVVFQAGLTGPGVPTGTAQALFGTDRNGRLVLLARYGQSYDAGKGPKTVGSFTTVLGSNSDDGLPLAFNDRGELAISLSFADGSGDALVRAAIPLPGDADRDGVVGDSDFRRLYSHLYQAGDQTQGDFNYDGIVNFADYQILERWFGNSLEHSTGTAVPAEWEGLVSAVPEPGMGALVLAGVGLLGHRRGRRAAASSS